VLKSGCARQQLEIKLFGGANLYDGPSRVGTKNSDFALNYLQAEGLRVVASDLGGNHPRVVHYHPATGGARRIFRKRDEEDAIIAERAPRYKAKLTEASPEGDVELFG
jgi:chemotaxis protein CheD